MVTKWIINNLRGHNGKEQKRKRNKKLGASHYVVFTLLNHLVRSWTHIVLKPQKEESLQ